MISAYLSEFDLFTPAQRATVDHWIIDDAERTPLVLRALDPDIVREQKEGYAYDPDQPTP